MMRVLVGLRRPHSVMIRLFLTLMVSLFSPDVQIFVDAGENGGYGGRWDYVFQFDSDSGSFVIRIARPVDGEWGEQVSKVDNIEEVYIEWYRNGALMSSLGPCYNWCGDIPALSCPDRDADGDVDLKDYADFINQFTGPLRE